MHIIFICNEYPPGPIGGVGAFVKTLGQALATSGHQVTVMGNYHVPASRVENDGNVRVVRLRHTDFFHMGFLFNGLSLRRELRRLHIGMPIDIIETPELGQSLLSASTPGVKVIRMHGGHHFFQTTLGQQPKAWRSWLERRSFARADHLCAVSHFVANTTRTLLHLGARPVEILPNPVDTEKFRPMPEVPEEEGLIVFAGTICDKKGVRELVQAMPAVIAAVPHARLRLFGKDWRNPATGDFFRKEYERLIPMALAERITFQGPVEHGQFQRELARAQVLVYPSYMEAMPIAWFVGMAIGKPLVASKLGPGPEVIVHERDGLLCDPRQPADIAAQLIRLLKDASLRRTLGTAARQRAVAEFSLATLLPRNEAFYRRCLASHYTALG